MDCDTWLVPFILLDPIFLPAYQVLQFTSEHLAVWDLLYFVFLDSIENYVWRWITLYMFSNAVHVVGSYLIEKIG